MAVIKTLGAWVELLQSEYKNFIWKYPEHGILVKQVINLLWDVFRLSGCTPTNERLLVEWQCIVGTVKQGTAHLSKTFTTKSLSVTLYGTHAVIPHEVETAFQGPWSNRLYKR
jgi:hypothetical protein